MPLAVVSGAAKGIGREIALALARANYDVVIHANRSVDELLKVRARIEQLHVRAFPIIADFSDISGQASFVEQILARYSTVDVVVHNAALYEEVPFVELPRNHFSRMLAVNLEAPLFITQGLLKALRRSDHAHVIHLLDTYLERPRARQAHYVASKTALASLTKALALELAPDIRVNGIAPGVVTMPEHFNREQCERLIERIPLKMVGSPQEIAETVLFLVRETNFITGQIIHIDGGRNIVP